MSYRLGLRLRSSSASPMSLGRPVDSLLRISSSRPIKFTSIPSSSPETRCTHASSNSTPEMEVIKSMRFGFTPSCTIWSGLLRSSRVSLRLPKPKSCSAARTASALSKVGRIRKSMSAVNRGYPCHATAKAPTIKYSTPAELSDSINSRKSLCIGVRILPGLKIEQDLNALSRGQSKVFFHISGVGFFMTGELTNDHFHPSHFSASIRPTTRKAKDAIS